MRLAEHFIAFFANGFINSLIQEREMLDFVYHRRLKLLHFWSENVMILLYICYFVRIIIP